MSRATRDLATRRMRLGFDRTLERFLWAACVPVSMACGFLGGYLWRKPVVVIEPPKLVAAPATYCACPISSKTSCIEVARMCYAQKRVERIRP